ncbi:hypothetical protein O6H91_02G009100 [Diphasiastrum complanatum]|uniref:Uncharacterized protein n=2 Tax=Diphasiastrum complanatum TaxID=34168 RepID=A0ACC2ECU1_DIPCM|nr:hypothetical protein O6H91_02G009100 [Diphasiastrum complanatum]KAJ7564245.1 hypothetical protein O6H91_02G009100 [Diphasiastrum complanatum]
MAEEKKPLAALVARLEASVLRLEALEGRLNKTPSSQAAPTLSHSNPLSDNAANQTRVTATSSAAAAAAAPSVEAFDVLVESAVKRVVDDGSRIGGQVSAASQLIADAFREQRRIVQAISVCEQPDVPSLQKLLKPLADVTSKANSLTEGKRTDTYNHLKTVAESLQALFWVLYTKDNGMSLPGPHIEESWQAAEFYNNKVLIEYRNKDAKHVDWAKAIKELYLSGLRDYVKKFHTTGPSWNEKGINVEKFGAAGVAPTAPPAPPSLPKGPPPPPPGPVSSASTSGSKLSMSAVFSDLNKGEAVTHGLRKVTDDMKTKNRAERSGVVAAGGPMVDKESNRATVSSNKGTPKFELQMDRKWVVENQTDNKNLVVSQTNARQSVYVYGCKGCVIQVHGKVNNITMDRCTKSGLVFKDVVAACEIVNCTSVEVQCQGTAPTIAIDNTNGCQFYLSKPSLQASITTAKSSEINVLVPGSTEDSDLIEHALPEQFLNVYSDGRFTTTPVSHSGG